MRMTVKLVIVIIPAVTFDSWIEANVGVNSRCFYFLYRSNEASLDPETVLYRGVAIDDVTVTCEY